MKKLKLFIVSAIMLSIPLNTTSTAYAASDSAEDSYVQYSIDAENDEMLADATLMSTDSHIENGRLITETVYRQPDGTIITDVLDVSAIAMYSKNGSDTVKRTRKIGSWGTITLKASFKWYTKGNFSYVKCSSMSASHKLDKKVIVNQWDKSYTKNYVRIGKAKAQIKYSFCNSTQPLHHQKGTFKITCSDSGTISDNN